jgi:murein DD-endopeptidase MepM/ murein hydrolase activator NlpD
LLFAFAFAGCGRRAEAIAVMTTRRPTFIWIVIAAALLAVALWAAARSGPKEVAPSAEPHDVIVGPSGLAIPVPGVTPGQLLDTYTQSTAGGAGGEDAIDIFAPAGTPVVAAAPGTIESLSNNDAGDGKTVRVRSEDGRRIYYYAHLQSYAPGLRQGRRVERGQPIGAVGSTGIASPRAPHLHFAIKDMAPNERWWQGRPVNPYPLFAGQ